MVKVRSARLPQGALLQRYAKAGAHTDCFAAEVPARVSLEGYVKAFYSSPVFLPERILIGLMMPRRRAGKAEVAGLAEGSAEGFSAWTVEAREENQIMLCDFQRRTRSWLMVAPGATSGATRLYFGSAVVQTGKSRAARWGEAAMFKGMLWFHWLYSHALLAGAARHLRS